MASVALSAVLALAVTSCDSTSKTSGAPPASVAPQPATTLVIDAANTPGLPRNFRVAAPNQPTRGGQPVNPTGLAELHESGSGTFSAAALPAIKDKIGSFTIVDLDLRQESHLYVNGMAVSWFAGRNDANLELSHDQVLADEARRKAQLVRDPSIRFGYIPGESVQPSGAVGSPKVVQTEHEVAMGAGLRYFRLTIPDYHRPQDAEVDRFVSFVRGLPPNTWLHIHCLAGVGRTTAFMAMYDMIRNAKTVPIDDILQRQFAVGGADLRPTSTSDPAVGQIAQFLRTFYDYARSNRDGFDTSFSAWLSAKGQ